MAALAADAAVMLGDKKVEEEEEEEMVEAMVVDEEDTETKEEEDVVVVEIVVAEEDDDDDTTVELTDFWIVWEEKEGIGILVGGDAGVSTLFLNVGLFGGGFELIGSGVALGGGFLTCEFGEPLVGVWCDAPNFELAGEPLGGVDTMVFGLYLGCLSFSAFVACNGFVV